MKYLLLAATLLSVPTMALAWTPQEPKPGAVDPRICTVDYDPDRVLQINVPVQKLTSIHLGPKEDIIDNPVANDIDLNRSQSDGSVKNVLYIRAKQTPMEPTPLAIRTKLEDGSYRDYAIEWSAYDDHAPVMVASKDGITTAEIQPPKPYCIVINYHYPVQEKAAQVAAWRKAQDKKQTDAAEIALHARATARTNNHYVAVGDTSLAPIAASLGTDAIWDDGNTTWLTFPGNKPIPTIITRFADGTKRQVDGITHEQGGVVVLHGVYAFLQLLDGGRTLCIYNKAFSAVGRNPGTGTAGLNVERTVGSTP